MNITSKVLARGVLNYKNHDTRGSPKLWLNVVLGIAKDIGRKKYTRVLEIRKEKIIFSLYVKVIIIS